jgi:cell division transport system ATP-binding protein
MQTRIQEVLNMVGVGSKGFKMPHQLSGGEQQRVSIARALINNPEIILADEPTGNLDPETSEGIIGLLYEISKTGTAVMIATHNYTLFDKFPARIIKCENGRLLDDSINKSAEDIIDIDEVFEGFKEEPEETTIAETPINGEENNIENIN